MARPSTGPTRRRTHRTKGTIAAGHPATAEAGAAIFAAGGNAFDAAIAALWMACVAEPVLASIGGGGFALVHRPGGGEPTIYDFFAQTPRRRRPLGEVDFQPVFADFGVTRQGFYIGVGAAAVPGFIRGIFAIHRDHGSLPMTELVAPAVAAARDGLIITPFQAYLLGVIAPIYRHTPAARRLFAAPQSAAPPREPGASTPLGPAMRGAGDLLVNRDLADFLEALAREGEVLFYGDDNGASHGASHGKNSSASTVAAAIEGLGRDGGGHLDRGDLAAYRALRRRPLRRDYRDAHLLTNPPPASGGALIAFGLGLFGGVEGLRALDPTARALLLAEILVATRDARDRHGATAGLLDPALLRTYAAGLPGLPTPPPPGSLAPPSTRGTTQISAIDGDANAVSITVSNGEGCGTIIPGTGSMLNNMLGEEDINPWGGDAWPENVRMGSMMAPTAIFADDGRLCVLGSGGSKRIRTAILQVLVNLIDLRMGLHEAIEAPRIHLDGEHLNWETGLPEATAAALAARFPEHTAWPGHNMYFGGVHAVIREASGALHGVGDPRRAGVCLDVD